MTRLRIEGMSCMHCVKAVMDALAGVPGVDGTPQVTLEPGAALVQGRASVDALIAAAKEAGYEASIDTDRNA